MNRIPVMAVMVLLTNMAAVQAQKASSPTVHQLTASQAVEMALKQRTEVLNARLDIQNQEAYNKEVTGMAYPQVKGSFGLNRNFAIPVTVLPDFISPSVYGVLEREGVKDANGSPIKWNGVVNTFPASFGVPWQSNVGLSIQQLLFQPDVFIGLKARSKAIDLYKNQLLVTEDSVKSNVMQAYFGVLIAERGLSFARESSARVAKLYNDQQALFKSGFIEKLDVEKTRVTLNNIKSTVSRLTSLVSLSYSGLKFALGIPQADSLVLTDALSVEALKVDMLALEAGFNYNQRNEIKALKSSNDLLQLQVKRTKLNALPTLAAFWSMQTSAQRQQFDFFNTQGRWFFSNIAGLNLSVPLTDGNQRRQRQKQAEIALQKNNNVIRQVEQVIDLQRAGARIQFLNALEALDMQSENKTLAEQVYQTTLLKYQRGLGSSFEILQSEGALEESVNNYYQALYNAVVAKIGFQRALGKL